jgi:CheY-like chemotaxis protein
MKRRCIIAEANPFIARLLQRFAEQKGLDIINVQVGQDVVELACQENTAVIILDPELPGKMRGWEVARQLRKKAETRAIPIIACSWMDETALRELAGELNGNLRKPEIHYEDFVSALKRAGVFDTEESNSGERYSKEERLAHE